jgi:hypothetical protein
VTSPDNKGMKLSKPEYLVGAWPIGLGIIESGFAAYAQCWADNCEPKDTGYLNR